MCPTLTELGYPGLRRADLVFDLGAGRHAARRSSQKLNAKMVEIAKTDEMKAKMRAINVDRAAADARGDRAYLDPEDTKRNAELIKAANIKLE